jgi:hypothetical protein
MVDPDTEVTIPRKTLARLKGIPSTLRTDSPVAAAGIVTRTHPTGSDTKLAALRKAHSPTERRTARLSHKGAVRLKLRLLGLDFVVGIGGILVGLAYLLGDLLGTA